MSLEDDLKQKLAELSALRRFRSTRPFDGPDRAHPQMGGVPTLAFCSNDYLGLASHPALADAAASATRLNGFGAGASRLVSGESSLHTRLEQALADYTGFPTALLFPTGYQTNIGTITALAGPPDLIVSDAANHASIIDGCRLSRARIVVHAHANADAAAQALATPGSFRRRFLITESVFSMDGDRAPLLDLAAAARQADAVLIVDEAHALGVAGPQGRGVCAELGVRPAVLIGTLGKAIGTAGGFAACTPTIRSFLLNTARTFIFTTAAPHPVVAASLAALEILTSPAADALRHTARENARGLRDRLETTGQLLPGRDLILPLILGSDAAALALSASLASRGIAVPAIRPPTVPEGTARLRITVSASHTNVDLDRLVTHLLEASPSP
jgi:8-amino-7-oxononanoate synthase